MSELAPISEEHLVVVVFDVEATSREAAHRQLVDALNFRRESLIKSVLREAGVESWWLPERDVKHIDGNNRWPYVLVPEDEA